MIIGAVIGVVAGLCIGLLAGGWLMANTFDEFFGKLFPRQSKQRRAYLEADLANVNALLAAAPADDVLGRTGLEARRSKIQAELHRRS